MQHPESQQGKPAESRKRVSQNLQADIPPKRRSPPPSRSVSAVENGTLVRHSAVADDATAVPYDPRRVVFPVEYTREHEDYMPHLSANDTTLAIEVPHSTARPSVRVPISIHPLHVPLIVPPGYKLVHIMRHCRAWHK
jgi:hypothetical protein